MNSIRIIKACELTPELTLQWQEIATARCYLQSPFLQPAFTRAVARVRDGVEIALMESEGQLQGVLPFQRGPRGLLRNVCGRLSEFHTPVVRPGVSPNMPDLLRACGLSWWQFDHLPVSESPLANQAWGTSTSPYIDISNGYESYVKERKAAGSSMSQTLRKGRKLEREVGPLRFEYHTTSEDAFQALVGWKDDQHRRTGRLRVMQYDWLLQLLRSLKSDDAANDLGLFSTLYAGDKLAAVHLGLRNESVIHLWFPAYAPELEEYSPGLVLLLRLAEEAAARGVIRLDLGRGSERYKSNFKSGDIAIAEGAIDLRPVAGRVRRHWYDTKRWFRNSRWKEQFEWPMEVTRRLRQKLAFE